MLSLVRLHSPDVREGALLYEIEFCCERALAFDGWDVYIRLALLARSQRLAVK